MNEIEHDGTLTLGHNVQIGYFAQNQASLLDENLTVFQTIDDVAKGEIRNKIRDLLGAFMFGGPEESMKKVKVLSGGERTRLAMIKLLLEPVNLLILDEPTNGLDPTGTMELRELIVKMAKEYAPFVRKIEIEVENLAMVKEAAEAGADIIMLDNMSTEDMSEAIRIIDGRAETECSGKTDSTWS